MSQGPSFAPAAGRLRRRLPGTVTLLAALITAGCATSPPVHFYSLYAPLDETPMAAGQANAARAGIDAADGALRVLQPRSPQAGGAGRAPAGGTGATDTTLQPQPGLRFEIAALTLPERLDRSNIVIHPLAGRQEAATAPAEVSLRILENSRFDAVLGDAFKDALAAHLATLAATGPTPVPARLRLTLQVYRFDARSDGRIDSLIDWRVRRLDEGQAQASEREYAGISCRFQSSTQAANGEVDALVAGMQQQVQLLAQDIVSSSRQWLRDDGRQDDCLQGS